MCLHGYMRQTTSYAKFCHGPRPPAHATPCTDRPPAGHPAASSSLPPAPSSPLLPTTCDNICAAPGLDRRARSLLLFQQACGSATRPGTCLLLLAQSPVSLLLQYTQPQRQLALLVVARTPPPPYACAPCGRTRPRRRRLRSCCWLLLRPLPPPATSRRCRRRPSARPRRRRAGPGRRIPRSRARWDPSSCCCSSSAPEPALACRPP